MLMHNVRLADPTDEFAQAMKKISAKKKKTEDDFEALSHTEFMGGFYVDDNGKYVVPGEVVEAVIQDGAKLERRGKDALVAIFCENAFILDKYDGPKDPEKRFHDKSCKDKRMVRIQKSRVLRTRPKFTNWSAAGTVMYDPSQVDKKDVIRWLEVAGQQRGCCDYRPKYGRFETEILKD